MRGYQRKKKCKGIGITFIFIVMTGILMIMGTGYSVWNAKLTIDGNAIMNIREEDMVPISASTTRQNNGNYATVTNNTALLFFTLISINSTSLINNDQGVIINTRLGTVIQSKDVTFSGSFTMDKYKELRYDGYTIVKNTITNGDLKPTVTLNNKTATFSLAIPVSRNIGGKSIEYKLKFLTEDGYKYYTIQFNIA